MMISLIGTPLEIDCSKKDKKAHLWNIQLSHRCAYYTLLPLYAARPHELEGSSPAQFVLLISHSRKNVMQCKEYLILYTITYALINSFVIKRLSDYLDGIEVLKIKGGIYILGSPFAKLLKFYRQHGA